MSAMVFAKSKPWQGMLYAIRRVPLRNSSRRAWQGLVFFASSSAFSLALRPSSARLVFAHV